MEVFIEKSKQTLQHKPCTGAQLLKSLDINPQTVLLVRNDEVVLDHEELSEDDKVKILSVVSGG
ncbi:MoaD/ThiS family protein [Candidatus Woesearchaeota archaeon]|nr:MoaD/ThiS family protein [Candidatus Woesearchaeota archaeon]